MKILAIETSCDDTGIAILEVKNKKFNVLSNIVSSQTIHQNYGGVFPMMAKREHQQNLVPTMIQALKQAKLLKEKKEVTILDDQKLKSILEKEHDLYQYAKRFLEMYEKPDIDVIAVTNGPGLEPCLWVGVNFARALSYIWNIPIVSVNHIEAHIIVNLLENPKVKFPALSLVVSGGHTQLILVKGIGKYKIIGETRDDAAGECFDKAAKMLGLGYPGGPIISKIASEVKKSDIRLPRPMIHSKDYDFSFSGLKTAILYATRDKKLSEQEIKEMCFEVQNAIVDVLVSKTIKAAKAFKVKTIILGGGVSANRELRLQFKKESKKLKVPVIFPDQKLSTDNALMIAVAGYFHKGNKKRWQSLKANANLRIGK